MIEINLRIDLDKTNDLSLKTPLTAQQRHIMAVKREEIENILGDLKCFYHLTHRTVLDVMFHNGNLQ